VEPFDVFNFGRMAIFLDPIGAAIAVGGRNVAGMLPMVGERCSAELPSHGMVYFAVDDCDAAAANVAELGGAVTAPPTDIPVGRLPVLNDPHGVVFSIIRMSQFDPGPSRP
jgi:predicted enzyme related to lactoylglutathione lyase